MKYEAQNSGGSRQITKFSKEEKVEVLEQIRQVTKAKRKEIEDKKTRYDGDAHQVLHLLSYVESAALLLDTERSKKEDCLRAFGLVLVGVAQLAATKNIALALESFVSLPSSGKGCAKLVRDCLCPQNAQLCSCPPRRKGDKRLHRIDEGECTESRSPFPRGHLLRGYCDLWKERRNSELCPKNCLDTARAPTLASASRRSAPWQRFPKRVWTLL